MLKNTKNIVLKILVLNFVKYCVKNVSVKKYKTYCVKNCVKNIVNKY